MNTASTTNIDDDDSINVNGMKEQANGSNRLNTLPFKDGQNVYRILPPFGKIAKEKGFPFSEVFLHWWRQEGSTKAGFPVLCTKKSDPAGCPICDEVDRQNVELEKALAKFTTASGDKQKINWNAVPDDLKAKAKRVRDISWQRHYYYNAVSPAGDIGILKLPKTLGDKLNAKIRACVEEDGYNPVSRKEGVFFVLTRTKTNTGKYDFDVAIKKQKVKLPDGDIAEKTLKGPLSEEVLAKLPTAMRDLYDLFKPQTAESLKKIMASKGKGDSDIGFTPADYNDDESVDAESKTPSAMANDVEEPSEEDVDALVSELGLNK